MYLRCVAAGLHILIILVQPPQNLHCIYALGVCFSSAMRIVRSPDEGQYNAYPYRHRIMHAEIGPHPLAGINFIAHGYKFVR